MALEITVCDFKLVLNRRCFIKNKLGKNITVYVESFILNIRNQRVITDADLARLYGVSTKALNQAIKRNVSRFPEDFVFRLTSFEKTEVITNCDHLKNLRFSRTLPYVFTEYGAIMAANVLNSMQAVDMSVFVVRAFVRMRGKLAANKDFAKRLEELEKKFNTHDAQFQAVFDAIRELMKVPEKAKRRIGYLEEPKALYRTR